METEIEITGNNNYTSAFVSYREGWLKMNQDYDACIVLRTAEAIELRNFLNQLNLGEDEN